LAAFKAAFDDALDVSGQDMPLFGHGEVTQVVPLQAVQLAFDSRYATESSDPSKRADAIRKAFQRGLKEARAASFVQEGHWDGIGWLWRPESLIPF